MTPRVVITGLGCLSALGGDVDQTWAALTAGRSGLAAIENIAGLKTKVAGQVKEFNADDHFGVKEARLLDRATQLALVAAQEAVKDANLSVSTANARAAVIVGNGAGPRLTTESVLEAYYQQHKRIPPYTVPKGLFNAPASHITMKMAMTGPAWMVNSACASSNHAFAQAFDLIKQGRADVVLAGGTEAPLTEPFFKAWEALRVMDPVTCRPFSKARKGLVLAEGAGIVVLESLSHAQARGAHIYAELAGYGVSSDADDLLRPSLPGATAALTQALQSTNLVPEKVDYINAHGTGTQLNDKTETQVIHRVLGEHARRVLISSTKSMLGHSLGASGALEMIATIKAIQDQTVPPTANFIDADPDCDLDYVPNTARPARVETAVSNAFAFGGLNAVIVLRKYDE